MRLRFSRKRSLRKRRTRTRRRQQGGVRHANSRGEAPTPESVVPHCAICNMPASTICGQCRRIAYCGAAHQKDDWPEHKAYCKAVVFLRTHKGEELDPRTLTELNLDGNNLGDAGAIALAAALPSLTALTTLELPRNNIGEMGCVALAKALPSLKALTTLNLEQNPIGDTGGRALAGSLRQTELTVLFLEETNLSHSVKKDIRDATLGAFVYI